MDTIQELQKMKEELIREIDEKFDWMIEKLRNADMPSLPDETPSQRNYEIIYPLSMSTGIFKGKRPIAIILANGQRIETPTWKSVMEELLKTCCQNPTQKQMLMDLRGRVLGRNRVLLGSETGNMRSPVQIADALYVETHYDTETLLRILTTRILNVVGYDYRNIRIAIKAE